MRFLGIDPGLRLTGYGCVELLQLAAPPRLLEAGVIRLSQRASLGERLAQLHGDLNAILSDLQPQRMVVEQVFTHAHFLRTAIQMGHARGVVLLSAQLAGVELDELAATEVKKAISGRGHASKRQMQAAVMAQCNLHAPPSPPDVADAIAIALCAARRYQAEAMARPVRSTA